MSSGWDQACLAFMVVRFRAPLRGSHPWGLDPSCEVGGAPPRRPALLHFLRCGMPGARAHLGTVDVWWSAPPTSPPPYLATPWIWGLDGPLGEPRGPPPFPCVVFLPAPVGLPPLRRCPHPSACQAPGGGGAGRAAPPP
jgi:hypothetical protein